MLINYQQLPQVAYDEIPDFFRIRFTPAEVAKMQQVAQVDVKNPAFLFVNDTITKKHAANDSLIADVEKWLRSPYAELEELRTIQSSKPKQMDALN